jgi:hypothetical protein
MTPLIRGALALIAANLTIVASDYFFTQPIFQRGVKEWRRVI